MTKEKLEEHLMTDMSLLEERIIADGEVPAVVFFHFDKVNKKIASMMNTLPIGKMPVKNGFMYAINDPILMKNRVSLMAHLGTIFAVMKILKVLEQPTALVFCAEAYASISEDGTLPKMRPSKDPKAKDIFIGGALTFDGVDAVHVKEKHMKIVKRGKKTYITPELTIMENSDDIEMYSPVLKVFFESYKESLKKIASESEHQEFMQMAEDDPVDAFRQGVEAAILLTRIRSIESL